MCVISLNKAGIELEFKGTGAEEKAFVAAVTNPEYTVAIGKEVVSVDPKYYRPTEVDLLLGDPSKAKQKLGWTAKTSLNELVREMVLADIEHFRKDVVLKASGFESLRQFE